MQLLAEENLPQSAVDALRSEGHDVLWARTECAGWKDFAILELARIVLTLDKDFWQIAVQRRIPLQRSGVVLFRVHPATPDRVLALVRSFVTAERNWSGYISIVIPEHIQMLPAALAPLKPHL
jgi:predicted nuclease of predicted toxin-antitoxin system